MDCNLSSSVQEDNSATGGDICGAWQNANFGNPFSTTTVNPDVLHGWGIRPYDWQFGVSVQQEILPRVSIDVSYNRRSWGNHFYTDNRAIGPQDFDVATITAPLNPNLPDGGGYPVTFVTRNALSPLGATDNYYTFASDYGDVTTFWHGAEVSNQCPHPKRHHLPGWDRHRSGSAGLLRGHGQDSGDFRDAVVGSRKSAGCCVRCHGAVVDLLPRRGDVYDPES